MSDRKKWLEERKTYIGGSDIGAIVGINSYKTALDIYFDKTTETIVEDEISEPAYWGQTLEDIVAQEYSKRTAYSLDIPSGLIRHKKYPYIACNIDYWANGGAHILECKTASFTKAKEWGEVGTNQIPEGYLYQVAYYSAITGVPNVDIAVLIGGQDFRIYQYLKDEEMEAKLIKAARIFWTKYIETGTVPNPKTGGDMLKLYPKASGLEVKASEAIKDKVEVLQGLKAQGDAIDDELQALQLDIKEYMKEADLLVANDGHVLASWKNRKGSKRLDTKRLKCEHADIYQQYMTEGNGSRTFLIKS